MASAHDNNIDSLATSQSSSEVQGPHPELFKFEHRLCVLPNGISVLLVAVPERKPPPESLQASLAAAGGSESQRPPSSRVLPTENLHEVVEPEVDFPRPQQLAKRSSLQNDFRSHLGQTSRTSLRQSYSGSIRSASSSNRFAAARRSSVQAYGYSLLEQSKRAEAQRKKLNASHAAGCALSVSIGSFSDPPNVQGLAHLVEHVVFMGSDLFPIENDWDRFMSIIGGDSNAMTEVERTTFHFTAPQGVLFYYSSSPPCSLPLVRKQKERKANPLLLDSTSLIAHQIILRMLLNDLRASS